MPRRVPGTEANARDVLAGVPQEAPLPAGTRTEILRLADEPVNAGGHERHESAYAALVAGGDVMKKATLWVIGKVCLAIWETSEALSINLGKAAPYVFGVMIGSLPRKVK